MKPMHYRRGLKLSSVGNLASATVESGDHIFIFGTLTSPKAAEAMSIRSAHQAVKSGEAFYAIPCTQDEAENV